MFAVPSALTASRMALRPNPCTMFGGARSTNWRSTSAMALQFAAERVDPAGIACAELGDGLMGAAFAGEQIAAVGRGQKILRAALDDPQAMLVQLQVGDDLAG